MSEAGGCSWPRRRPPPGMVEPPRCPGRQVWRAARSFAGRRICWRRPRARLGCGVKVPGGRLEHRPIPPCSRILRGLVEPATMGDPHAPAAWARKSREKLAAALRALNHAISANTVAKMLTTLG